MPWKLNSMWKVALDLELIWLNTCTYVLSNGIDLDISQMLRLD